MGTGADSRIWPWRETGHGAVYVNEEVSLATPYVKDCSGGYSLIATWHVYTCMAVTGGKARGSLCERHIALVSAGVLRFDAYRDGR